LPENVVPWDPMGITVRNKVPNENIHARTVFLTVIFRGT
jgi:hypothetical protein